jgi:hypothetical protein
MGRRKQTSATEVDEVVERFWREFLLVLSLLGMVST